MTIAVPHPVAASSFGTARHQHDGKDTMTTMKRNQTACGSSFARILMAGATSILISGGGKN